MHRVELKGSYAERSVKSFPDVPNAPCGVESPPAPGTQFGLLVVPNAPCGVERSILHAFIRLKMKSS